MTKVLVLLGGTSDEREVSLRSGHNVQSALKEAGYATGLYDPADSPISLDEATKGYDIVFSALHGAGGEDGTMQMQLDHIGIPYIGSDVYSSELCYDKWNYRALLQAHNLPVAKGELVDTDTFRTSALTSKPYVLKPPKGGSSIDTIIVRDPALADMAAIEADFRKHRQLLLEELILGIEITVGILDEAALPVIEIIPPERGEFDYENKYNGKSQELCPPLNVSSEIQKRAQDLTLQIHKLCGCKEFSRTDIMVAHDGALAVLETNTIPGLTEQSLLPKAAATAGISMAELCDRLVQMTRTRKNTSHPMSSQT